MAYFPVFQDNIMVRGYMAGDPASPEKHDHCICLTLDFVTNITKNTIDFVTEIVYIYHDFITNLISKGMKILKRNLEKKLETWKKSSGRKPLILRGARQVGKTTLIKEFAKSYKYSILLNLEKQADADYFLKYNEAKTIIESLFLSRNISIASASDTLLFLDEIQELPEAIQMLRYFYEEFPDLHVIAAGSLLEFAMRKVKSFPVGRVEFLYLHPLNFIEYLEAIGHRGALDKINKIPCESFAHPVLLGLFNQYAIIGGMPEVISSFIEK
jgi:uncharacterized protein